MQIAKILFWINVNLCSSTTGGPVAWRCPLPACTGTIMPGEDDIPEKNASQKCFQEQGVSHLDTLYFLQCENFFDDKQQLPWL